MFIPKKRRKHYKCLFVIHIYEIQILDILTLTRFTAMSGGNRLTDLVAEKQPYTHMTLLHFFLSITKASFFCCCC